MICPKCGHDLSTETSIALSGNAMSLILDEARKMRAFNEGFNVDVHLEPLEPPPSHDGHGDDGDLLAGP